jgi:hypothetical protein
VLIKGATGFHVREGPSVMARTTLTPAQLARNRLGGIRSKVADPEAAEAARRELAEHTLAGKITRTFAKVPIETWEPDRLARLRALLTPGGGQATP